MFGKMSIENKIYVSTLINESSDLLRKLIDDFEIYDVYKPKNGVMKLSTKKIYKPEDSYGLFNTLEIRQSYWEDKLIIFLVELASINNEYLIEIPNKDGNMYCDYVLKQIRNKMLEIINENKDGTC